MSCDKKHRSMHKKGFSSTILIALFSENLQSQKSLRPPVAAVAPNINSAASTISSHFLLYHWGQEKNK